ncbi:MAG: hypothetical protein OSB09_00640 [Planctomycetota bacterium]|nr:hypothetical protein [Planctomycetota bacterium]
MSSNRDPVDRLLSRIRLRRRLREVMGHSSNALALALISWAILILLQRLFSLAISETLETTLPLGAFLLVIAAAFLSVRKSRLGEAVEAERGEQIPQTISTSLLARGEGFSDEATDKIMVDAAQVAERVDLQRAIELGKPRNPWRVVVALCACLAAISFPTYDLLGIEEEKLSRKKETDRSARKVASLERRLRDVTQLAERHQIDPETQKLLKALSRKPKPVVAKTNHRSPETSPRKSALERAQKNRSQVASRMTRAELKSVRATADRVRQAGQKKDSPGSEAATQLQTALQKGQLGRAGQELQKLAKAAASAGAKGQQARADLAKLAEALGLSDQLSSKLKDAKALSQEDLQNLSQQLDQLAKLLRESELLDHARKQIQFTEAELSALPSEWPDGPPPEICPACLAGT